MNNEELAAIEAQADAATPGPWELDHADTSPLEIIVSTADNRPWGWVEVARSIAADANFIAHARTDVPALLALVREQAAKLEAVRAIASSMDRIADFNLGILPHDNMGISLRQHAGDLRAALEVKP